MNESEIFRAAIICIADTWVNTRTRDKYLPDDEVQVAILVDQYLRRPDVGLPQQGGVLPSTIRTVLDDLRKSYFVADRRKAFLEVRPGVGHLVGLAMSQFYKHKKNIAATPS